MDVLKLHSHQVELLTRIIHPLYQEVKDDCLAHALGSQAWSVIDDPSQASWKRCMLCACFMCPIVSPLWKHQGQHRGEMTGFSHRLA